MGETVHDKSCVQRPHVANEGRVNAYEPRLVPHKDRHQYRHREAQREHNDLVIPGTETITGGNVKEESAFFRELKLLRLLENITWTRSKFNARRCTRNSWYHRTRAGRLCSFLRGKMSYLSKNFITGSAAMSLISILLPYSFTAGSRLTISQPIWEKKNPRVASCGSAHVSVYLWCVLWSRIHL